MPSQLLHILFGEDVYAQICRRMESGFGTAAHSSAVAWEKIATSNRKAFALGCQGPDIFYHSQGRRPVGLEYGTLLHRRGAGSFTARLLRMSHGNDALGAYALGFLTHAILDRLAHPYIVYKSNWAPSRINSREAPRFENHHAFFERIIDVLMLKLLRGAEISSWDQEGLLAVTCEDPPLGLRELLAAALIATFPERAGKDEKLSLRIENALLDCAGFYRLTAPAYQREEDQDEAFPIQKHHLVYLYPKELPGCIDFLNLEKRPWYCPAGEKKEDRRSFPEIYAGAVAAAADSLAVIISRYPEEVSFPFNEAVANAIGEAIGDGGLNIVDESGKPCAPCRTEPLPLQEVLQTLICQ